MSWRITSILMTHLIRLSHMVRSFIKIQHSESPPLQPWDERMQFLRFFVYSIIDIIHKICYNMLMKDIYKHTKTTVSLINYHFVFCPRYRRKIFLIPGVEEAFKKEAVSICQNSNIDILAMECHVDHVHISVSVLPQMSVPEIMRLIKGGTASVLRTQFKELSQMKSLWTRSYFVSTAENVSSETIKWYVDTQKRRY